MDTPEKQYLVTTVYRDGSRGRHALTWAQVQKRFENPPMVGATVTIEDL